MPAVTVYKASAGSGKTFTLAIQYIRLLITLNPQEYRHTLAVTFTNKATAEMKNRILEQLYGLGKGLKSSEGYLNALRKGLEEEGIALSEEEIRQRCRTALRYILHDYSRFRIETIDSFFQSVLRNLAHELGLNARLQVDLNDKQILSQAVDNLVDDLGKEPQSEVLPWIDAYVKEQIENSDKWDVRDKIKSLSKIIFKEEYMRRDESFRQSISDEKRIKQYRDKLYRIKREATQLMAELAQQVDEALRAFPGDITQAVSRGTWIPTYRDLLLHGAYDEAEMTEKRYNDLQDCALLVKKKDQDNAALLAQLEPVRRVLWETETQRLQYVTLLNTIRLSLQHLNPLRLLNHIETQVTDISHEANRFILAKTPILLSRLIQDSDAPFVFEKMGTLFHNVMIDEFQDTSRLQWENFKVLLLESQASGGQDLLVGDIKQSIYRFRNGDWRILKHIEQELKHIAPTLHTLDTNYRSDVHVIRFNNAFFPLAAQHLSQAGEGESHPIIQEIFSDVVQQWPKGKPEEGYVRIQLRTGKREDWPECMLSDMCQQIATLHAQGLPYNQMAVLVRSRTHVPQLIAYVQEHLPQVKMVSDEGFKLSNSLTLSLLIAALRWIDNGAQDPVAERYLVAHYSRDILGEARELPELTQIPLEEMLPERFVTRREELQQYPLHELAEEVYRLLLLERITDEDAYVLYFFDELADYLRNGTSDIHSFLEYWDSDLREKAIPPSAINGISIVTIHRSKGLQYHTVFMPFCDQPMEDVRADHIIWCDTGQEPFNTLGALPISSSSTLFEASAYRADYHEEQLQRRIEELNTLYVAFTRAEHNLYVWGNATGKKLTYATLLHDTLSHTAMLAPSTQEEGEGVDTWTYGQVVTQIDQADKPHVSKNRMEPVYAEQPIRFHSHNRRLDFQQSNEAAQFIRQQADEIDEGARQTEDGLSYIEQGKLLHSVFESIQTAEQVEEVLQTYADRGIITQAKQQQRIAQLVKRALQHPQVRGWFDGQARILNECEIVHLDPQGHTVSHRPDRVMLTDQEVIIVDFKFGRPNPTKYIPQVQGYMALMQTMYPQHRIKGYLWYVYRNHIEEVHPDASRPTL